jgi:DNA-directed RNA polymerase II subunit RPB7
MFFLYNLERQVTLHPSYFGRNMHELVTGKLLKDVEGTCTGRYFIITIMDTFNISEGRILPGSGLAEFTVGYRAVVWRPFKGETVRYQPQSCLDIFDSSLLLGRCYRHVCQSGRLLR